MLEKMSKTDLLAIAGALLFAILFIWFCIRPASARSHCSDWAKDKAIYPNNPNSYDQEAYDDYYQRCLRERGVSRN